MLHDVISKASLLLKPDEYKLSFTCRQNIQNLHKSMRKQEAFKKLERQCGWSAESKEEVGHVDKVIPHVPRATGSHGRNTGVLTPLWVGRRKETLAVE